MVARNERGSVAPAMILLLLAIAFAGFGAWSLLRQWRFLVEKQLRIDRCVAEAALELRNTLNTIDELNDRLIKIRAAEALTSISPSAKAALEASTFPIAVSRDFAKKKWNLRRFRWNLGSCSGEDFTHGSLPGIEMEDLTSDELGARDSRWLGERPEEFQFQLNSYPRHAAARVYLEDSWKAKWSAPHG